MGNVKVRFLESYTVKDDRAGTPEETSYAAGKTYEMPESSAAHFISRGRAEIHKAREARKRKPRQGELPDESGDANDSPPGAEDN